MSIVAVPYFSHAMPEYFETLPKVTSYLAYQNSRKNFTVPIFLDTSA